MKRILLASVCALALAGCTAATNASVTATVSSAQTKLQTLLNTWPIDKGILMAGSIGLSLAGQPEASALVNAGIARGDALVAQTQATLDSASVTAASLEAISGQFTDLVATLKLRAAPAIIVTPTPPG